MPEPQRTELGLFLAACAAAAPDFRWTPASNLHLTVRFVGDVDRALVEGIADRLGEVVLPAFELELGDVGTFKRGRLARVVWLGLRGGEDVTRLLAGQVEAECGRAGLAGEKRAFQAHVTLARARSRDGSVLPMLPDMPGVGSWRATELLLYSSRITKGGAVYEPLRTVGLK